MVTLEEANKLARDAVKFEMEKHQPYSPTTHTVNGPTTYCKHDGELWPCRLVTEMGPAEEAISAVEEDPAIQETQRVIARFQAGLKLIAPDDITPMGKRMLEKILAEEIEKAPEVCPYDCDNCHSEDCPCTRMGCAGDTSG